MALIDQLKLILQRLAPLGWRDLMLQHGLDITANALATALSAPLTINRTLPGFEDFAAEGVRAIEAGRPERSLLYHAFASPNVTRQANGRELGGFPTLAEIEILENYIYGLNAPSLADLRARAQGALLAIAVFAYEYRPAAETVHRRNADLCFARTGIARVGTANAQYLPANRGFLPFVDDQPNAMRVLPARYAAYIAIQMMGNNPSLGVMRPQTNDATQLFWVPLHKLFAGNECIRGLDLHLSLTTQHINEKIRRVHIELGRRGVNSGWREPDISQAPFVFNDGIAMFAVNPEFGTGLLMPTSHPHMVEAAVYQGKPLVYNVPANAEVLSSSFSISADRGARLAPEYVHARHRVNADGSEMNLNEAANAAQAVATGGYQARHYVDFTGDGWVDAQCPELAIEIPRRVPAYSLVTAPDFFPNTDQRELLDWVNQSVPSALRQGLWRVQPLSLSDDRHAPNLQIPGANFRAEDKTVTAIVSQLQNGTSAQMPLIGPPTRRHTHLPDGAAGVFAPGWDVSLSRAADQTMHLAAYGLGSPFPEDGKLCAALSTFWPAVAPDATRTFEPQWNGPSWFTVAPLTDDEIGQTGNQPWDGIAGPRMVRVGNRNMLEYNAIDHADYVENALNNRFSLTLTGAVDVNEYESRVLATARAYRALGANTPQQKSAWAVFSFRVPNSTDPELRQAQTQTGIRLQGRFYRLQMVRHGAQSTPANAPRKRRVQILELVTLYVDPLQILVRRANGAWQVSQ